MLGNKIIYKKVIQYLKVLLFIAIILELVFFPSFSTFLGCVMEFLVLYGFSYFISEKYIIFTPFSFITLLTLFLYRYLPLFGTLFDLHPITYGFQNPNETFIYETITFYIILLSYYFSFSKSNNLLKNLLHKYSFYEISLKQIWILGILGMIARLNNFSLGDEFKTGDISGKFFQGFVFIRYSPLILFFPKLLNLKQNIKNYHILYFYFILLNILEIASNSRENILGPILTVSLLALINFFYFGLNKKINYFKLSIIFVLCIVGFGLLSLFSDAMLAVRGIRGDINKSALFQSTIDYAFSNENVKNARNKKNEKLINYIDDWDETYLNNFILNRYANLRISDETIYYANKIGFGDKKMLIDLFNKVIDLLPSPIANLIFTDHNKDLRKYSRGDFLSNRIEYPSYLVTNITGDGLATFGYSFFLILLIVFFFYFKLVNTFVFISGKSILISPISLILIYFIFGFSRNGNGIYDQIAFILRTFWEKVLIYLFLNNAIKKILN